MKSHPLPRTLLLHGLLLLFAGPASPADEVQKPHLTETEAARRASEFCRRTGNPVTAAPSVRFPLVNRFHWQRRWEITFPEQAQVEVIDADGTISAYRNEALRGYYRRNLVPAGPAIPEAETLRRAAEYMTATGSTAELGPPRAHLMQFAEPPRASTHTWTVTWGRRFDGIPYLYQQATAILDAQTGTLQALGKSFFSRPPARAAARVTRERALQAAGTHLTGRGIAAGAAADASLLVVQPNTFWQPGGSNRPAQAVSRVVWACRYARDGRVLDVWIDEESGQVVGGTAEGGRGAAPKAEAGAKNEPKPAKAEGKDAKPEAPRRLKTVEELQEALKGADEVRLTFFDFRKGSYQPAVTLSKDSHPEKLRLLKEGFRPPKQKGLLRIVSSMKFEFRGKGGPTEASYSSSGSAQPGILYATTGEWGTVSDEFRDWLDKLVEEVKSR